MEFLVITTIVVFFFTLFFVAIQSTAQEKNQEKENILLREIGQTIQDEITLASSSENGYSREFNLPSNILGKDYALVVSDNYLNLKTSSQALTIKILNYSGVLIKGKNIIRKENNSVYLN